MRILVTGGRDYADPAKIDEVLSSLMPFTHLIHGGARGADTLAADWAWATKGIQVVTCKANWDLYGNRAGPIRNRAMLALDPDLIVAFPGGAGTADMIRQARAANASIQVIRED